MSEDKLGERMATTEETVKSHSRRLSKLEENNDILTRLVTVVEMQDARDVKQDEQMEKFSDTLCNINENLTLLNNTSDQLKINVGDLGERINSIEKTQNSHKIDVPKLMTKILIGIAMVSVAIFSAWILQVSGLK